MPYKNSAFAGEMLVAAELSRLGYEVLLGNVGSKKTVGIDLIAFDPETGKSIPISVKSLKSRNAFLIDPEKVHRDYAYVFVITNSAGKAPEFFVCRGSTLLKAKNQRDLWGNYGASYQPAHGRGIGWKKLEHLRSRWELLNL